MFRVVVRFKLFDFYLELVFGGQCTRDNSSLYCFLSEDDGLYPLMDDLSFNFVRSVSYSFSTSILPKALLI